MILTRWQRKFLATYSGGAYEHLFESATTQRHVDRILKGTTDNLFKFIMVELSSAENCDSLEDAKERLMQVAETVDQLRMELGYGEKDDEL